jgi:hypothetical protein
MIWEHGKYFLSLSEVKDFEVWLCGGFLEKWTSWDIDIILIGPRNEEMLKKIMYKGMNLGITKYNMYVDIAYQISPDYIPVFRDSCDEQEIEKLTIAKKIIEDGKVISNKNNTFRTESGLYQWKDIYPKHAQMINNRQYKNKPKCIKQLNYVVR